MRKLPAILLFFCLLSACAPVQPLVVATLTPAPVATSSLTVTVALPTDTPSPVPSPILSPTDTPNSKIIQRCIKIGEQEVLLRDIIKSGAKIVDRRYLLNLETEAQYELPVSSGDDGNIVQIFFSPDEQKLVYLEMLSNETGALTKEIFRVVDVQGNLLAETTFNQSINLHRWINNHSIEIYTSQTINDGSVIIFNIFTQEQRTVHNELPNLYQSAFPITGWHVEYSSDLEWVVYRGIKTDQDEAGPIVWDVNAKKILWQSPFLENESVKPAWSPKGGEVAISTNDSLYIVNRNGQARLILDASENIYIDHLAWSPDGRYIAFRGMPKTNLKSTLMIYDTRVDQTTDYCIVSDQIYSTAPEWLANSHQLMVAVWNRKENNNLGAETILVDLEKDIAYQLK